MVVVVVTAEEWVGGEERWDRRGVSSYVSRQHERREVVAGSEFTVPSQTNEPPPVRKSTRDAFHCSFTSPSNSNGWQTCV